ncbi:MAG: histidine kinase, partial [Bacteroidota bacterium]
LFRSVDFTVPDFSYEGERRYQTKLVGFDPDWNTPTITNSVRYTKLNPGSYAFQLRAFDAQGRSTAAIKSVKIEVQKPWYNTYFFYFCCVGALLLFLNSLHQSRMARLAKDLEAERRVQSLELRSLRQQLNPHFISNAMNAIREYIQRSDPKDAAKYLTDFSLMMRLFLESSRRRQTTIADETNMLSRYINLEQLRFPGKFTTEIRIDPEIDPDMDEVPSLLLQPVVENAINHGLRPLESGGELRIDIYLDPEDEDVLICKVSDNGIGRKEAAKRPKTTEHVSRATQILADRTNLLEEDAKIRLTFTTEDLYPEKKHTGTVVTMKIEGC